MSDEDIATSRAAMPTLHQANQPGAFSFRRKLDEMAAPYAVQPVRRYDSWTVFMPRRLSSARCGPFRSIRQEVLP